MFKKKTLFLNQSSLGILRSRASERGKAPNVLEDGNEFSLVHTLRGCFFDGTGSTEAQVKGSLFAGAEDVQQTPTLFVLSADSERRAQWWDFTPPSGPACCGVLAAGLRRRECNNWSIQENRWLRCIMGGRKESDIEWVVWLRETKRAAHSLRYKLGLPALWHRALAAIHFGQDTRLGRRSSTGATVVQWRNVEWWEVMKSAGASSSGQSWRHPKKNWVRGFESTLFNFCGETLQETAVRNGRTTSAGSSAKLYGFGVDRDWPS